MSPSQELGNLNRICGGIVALGRVRKYRVDRARSMPAIAGDARVSHFEADAGRRIT